MTSIEEKTRRYVYQTWSRQADAHPKEIVRSQGSWFEDSDGKRWLDFASQVYNASLGHQHPRLVEAIKRQADTLCVAGPKAAYEAKALLGEKLAEICPGDLEKTFFCLGGAEANENAIKMARQVSGRFKVITRYRSYHGATLGALAATGDPRRLPFEPGAPGIVRVQDPYCYRCPFGQRVESCARECVSHIEDVIRFEGPDSIAAILMEGFAGANGGLVPPSDYWPRVRELCDRYGILLISDEVFTGLGRTGRWFAVDHWGVVPDMMTLAKGLGAGHAPLGAVVTSRRIADYFEKNTLWCGLTGYAPPICVATALESLRVYEEEGVIANAAAMGDLMMKRLRLMRDTHPLMGDVRGKGLLAVVELSEPRTRPLPHDGIHHETAQPPLVPWNASAKEMQRLEPLVRVLVERGLYLHLRWNFVIVTPPLNVSEADLSAGLEIVEAAIGALESAYEHGQQRSALV